MAPQAELNRLVDRRREATEALLAADNDERRRAILSPSPAPPPRERAHRVGFGGAVLRAGDRQLNYEPLPQGYNEAARIRRENEAHRWFAYPRPRFAARFQAMLAPVTNYMGRGMGTGIGMGMGMGMADVGVGGAGRREDDVAGIISKVDLPEFDPPQEGYMANFEIDESVKASKPTSPIALDEDGRVISTKPKSKPYLACANCPEPLLVSSAYRTGSDRVWALRCGHMIDQRCLDDLSTPSTEDELASVHRHPPGDLPVLGADSHPIKKGRKRAKVTKKTSPPAPDEYEWKCPVDGCGRVHCSVREGENWKQKEGEGALSVYA